MAEAEKFVVVAIFVVCLISKRTRRVLHNRWYLFFTTRVRKKILPEVVGRRCIKVRHLYFVAKTTCFFYFENGFDEFNPYLLRPVKCCSDTVHIYKIVSNRKIAEFCSCCSWFLLVDVLKLKINWTVIFSKSIHFRVEIIKNVLTKKPRMHSST